MNRRRFALVAAVFVVAERLSPLPVRGTPKSRDFR